MEVIEEASYLVVYIRVEAEEFFSLDNTSLGVLAHFSGVVLVLVGLIQFLPVPSKFPVQISSLYFVSLTVAKRLQDSRAI